MASPFKTTALALATALAGLLGSGTAAAQDYTFGWNPRSGDVWVDTRLDDVNRYGSRYREPFVDEMVRYYGAPRDLVSDLLLNRRWAPGDVYYACSIAQILGRPCRYVVDEWERDHGQGWGVVAKRLGIKPGSPEFHRLKKGFVPTYDRWARPIDLDVDLRRDFPNRAHAGPGRAAHGKADVQRGPGNGQGKGPAHAGKGGGKPAAHGNGGDHGKGAAAPQGGPGKGGQGKGKGKGGADKGGGHGNGKH